MKEWLDTKPYQLRTDFHAEHREYILRLERAPKVPLRLLTIIGDVVHNLRSALDHLIYRIAVLESRRDPPPKARDVGFPINAKEEDFDRGRKSPLGKLSAPMRADIKALQPFSTHPDDVRQSRLWVLNRLDAIDKHRELLLGLTVVRAIPIEASAPISVHAGPGPGPLKDGAQILAYRSDAPDVRVKIDPAFELVFGESDIFPQAAQVSEILSALFEIVDSIVGSVSIAETDAQRNL